MASIRDERPTYQLNEQEKSWTAHKFMILMAVTLLAAIGAIMAAARASYDGLPFWPF